MKVRTLCFSSCFKHYTFISSFYMNYNAQHTWIFPPLFILKTSPSLLALFFWCRKICCSNSYLSVLRLPATSVTPAASCRESIARSTSLEPLQEKLNSLSVEWDKQMLDFVHAIEDGQRTETRCGLKYYIEKQSLLNDIQRIKISYTINISPK